MSANYHLTYKPDCVIIVSEYHSGKGEYKMKKKLFSATLSLIMCVCLLFSSIIGTSAAGGFNIADIIGALSGTSNGGGSINLSQAFADYLQNATKEEDESIIDKFVDNIKNKFNGTTTPDTDTDTDTEDDSVTLDKGAATNIAELFNITVNELKKGTPGYTETVYVSVAEEMDATMASFAGVLSGLFDSLVNSKDLFAGVIGGIEKETTVTTKYQAGGDVINNLPVSGKDYVACLTSEDIKDYSITIYRSGAYKMHIDLNDVEGSAAQSGLAHVFNTTDQAFTVVKIGSTALNINVKLKYVNNYVECQVNRDGEITSYTTNTGVTFLFQQEDGTYSPEMPYFGVNFEEKGIIYTINTEYSGINFQTRPMGDASNDGKVNSTDARLILRASCGLDKLDAAAVKYCDVTRDERISAADAREILRASAMLTKLPTTEEALGIKDYKMDEATEKHIDDLLILLMAYEAAADAEEQQKLQNSYNDKYDNTNKEEETTGELNTPSNKVEDALDFIGGILGGGSIF